MQATVACLITHPHFFLTSTTSPTDSFRDLALDLFRDHVFTQTQLMPRLIDSLLDSIERERCEPLCILLYCHLAAPVPHAMFSLSMLSCRRGEAVNRNRVKHLLSMLLALRLYDKAFEPKFLEASSDFFRAEGGRLIIDLAVSRDTLRWP